MYHPFKTYQYSLSMSKKDVFTVFNKKRNSVSFYMKFTKKYIRLKRNTNNKYDFSRSNLFIRLEESKKGCNLIIKQRPSWYVYIIILVSILLYFTNQKDIILFKGFFELTLILFSSLYFFRIFYLDQQYTREKLEKWFDPFIKPVKDD